jgi:PTH1 family peptidyl-tRNA hydrolase
MKLILGLGNPGKEYSKTRHNLGFMVVDKFVSSIGVHLDTQKKLKCELAVTMTNGETIIIAKPSTFMNLSGSAVQKIKQFYKIENNDIWVVSDDLDLEFGTIRTRIGGSSGGHNGLKDIIENIGEDFVRIRVGIKNSLLSKQPAEEFVLKPFNKTEGDKLPDIVDKSVEVIKHGLQDGIEHQTNSI